MISLPDISKKDNHLLAWVLTIIYICISIRAFKDYFKYVNTYRGEIQQVTNEQCYKAFFIITFTAILGYYILRNTKDYIMLNLLIYFLNVGIFLLEYYTPIEHIIENNGIIYEGIRSVNLIIYPIVVTFLTIYSLNNIIYFIFKKVNIKLALSIILIVIIFIIKDIYVYLREDLQGYSLIDGFEMYYYIGLGIIILSIIIMSFIEIRKLKTK